MAVKARTSRFVVVPLGSFDSPRGKTVRMCTGRSRGAQRPRVQALSFSRGLRLLAGCSGPVFPAVVAVFFKKKGYKL